VKKVFAFALVALSLSVSAAEPQTIVTLGDVSFGTDPTTWAAVRNFDKQLTFATAIRQYNNKTHESVWYDVRVNVKECIAHQGTVQFLN